MQIRCRVFGGLRVWVADREIDVRPVRAVPLLSTLVLARGEPVAVADLLDVMWGPGAPASAVNQLHRLVGSVRRLLEPGLGPRDHGAFILGTAGGYRLATEEVDSDLTEFTSSLARARAAVASGDGGGAVRSYCTALEVSALPLASSWSTDESPALHAMMSGLQQDRLAAVSEALDTARDNELLPAVIRHAEVVAAAHPFEELLQARLVRALGAVGRRADALAWYDRIRQLLAEEVGMDPGRELAAAQRDVLALDAATARASAVPAVSIPRELPPIVRGYVERPDIRAALSGLAQGGEPPVGSIVVLTGLGGVGKTAVAVRWAHVLSQHFPDGQLFLNLRGFDAEGRVMQPLEAVTALLASLGITPPEDRSSLDSRSAMLRTALADKRLLMLLDNAHDADQVRALLPGSPYSLVVVTSRLRLGSLVAREAAQSVLVGPMADDQALRLLVNRVGEGRLSVTSEATSRVLAACAGLPLALSIVAARIALSPHVSVADLTRPIAGPQESRVGSLSGWQEVDATDDVSAVLAWSYDALTTDARRALRLVAVHYAAAMSAASIASVLALGHAAAARLIEELVDASLLEQTDLGRFRIHDLVAAFASDLAALDPERSAAERRLLAHYVHSTRAAWSAFGRPPVGELEQPAPGVAGEVFEDTDAAVRWYDRERSALIATLHRACELGWDEAAAHIAIDWRPMNQRLDPPSDTQPHAVAALEAARRHGDPVMEAELLRDVGSRASRLGDHEAAVAHLEAAITAFRAAHDLIGEANTLRNLSANAHFRGLQQMAFRYATEGLAVARQASNPQVLAVALRDLGWQLTETSRLPEAEECLTEGLELAVSLRLTDVEAEIRYNLTVIYVRMGRPQAAWAHAQTALTMAATDPGLRFTINVHAAKAALDMGDPQAAAQACRRAHDDLDGPGDVDLLDLGSGWESDIDVLASVEAALAAENDSRARVVPSPLPAAGDGSQVTEADKRPDPTPSQEPHEFSTSQEYR